MEFSDSDSGWGDGDTFGHTIGDGEGLSYGLFDFPIFEAIDAESE